MKSLLELCDLTLGRTKFFASIILLISEEVLQQRIQIIIHSAVMESNIFIEKNNLKIYSGSAYLVRTDKNHILY